MDKIIGIIAGSGFYDIPEVEDKKWVAVRTDFGDAKIMTGKWNGTRVVFLTRHGVNHTLPPHMINYRANVRALKESGVEQVIAINVVGAIDSKLKPGDLTLIDDFIDFTSGRAHTFFDGSGEEGVRHVDVSHPYDKEIQTALLESASRQGITLHSNGVYAGTNGPRFETAAEIRLAALVGATVVGMTGCPEVSLAREADLPYATVALVVNPATGQSKTEITLADIQAALDAGRNKVLSVIKGALPNLNK